VRRSSLYPLLGPALLLYLLADVSAAQGNIDVRGYVIAVLSVLLSAAVLVRVDDADDVGLRHIGRLGFGLALALLRFVVDTTLDLPVEIASVVGLSLAATSCLELALHVPDAVVPGRYARLAALAPRVLGAVAAVLSTLALAPAFSWLGVDVLLPAAYARAAGIYFGVSVVMALVLRVGRRRLGSTPEALAANVWAMLGLGPAVVLSGLAWLAVLSPSLALPVDARALAPIVAVVLVVGHLWLIDPRRRSLAGSGVRELVAVAVSGTLVGCALFLGRAWIPTSPVAFVSWAVAMLVSGLVLLQGLRPWVQRVLAPHGGQLLVELEAFPSVVGNVHGLMGLARLELLAMRRASGLSTAQPLLYTLDPALEIRIDAAGETHQGDREVHPAILEQLRTASGEVVVRAPLEAKIVRQPKLRSLVQALTDLDALCVVPLAYEGDLEGVLVVPRGERKAALTLEELQALSEHARFVAALLAMFCAQARAEARAHGLIAARDRAEAGVERLEDQLAQARADLELLSSGRALRAECAELVAYSPAMRVLREKLRALASHDIPVLLHAERGLELEGLARALHEESGRGAQPVVTLDCAALRQQDAAAALFGGQVDGQRHPGALRVAGAGTLLLIDVAALPREVQRSLAVALASRGARTVEGREAYSVSARVVGTCPVGLQAAAAGTGVETAAGFDPELQARFVPSALRVPPLRERAEDIESLALLALDRACRRVGRAPLGFSPEALDSLKAHAFAGNLPELEDLIQRAALTCTAERIGPADLALGDHATRTDVLDGSLEDIEKRALQHALTRALGNKSEAARLLGLPRTTFIDKLRRYKLDDGARDSLLPPN
jgi:DNA-binding NtrC family response regulator